MGQAYSIFANICSADRVALLAGTMLLTTYHVFSPKDSIYSIQKMLRSVLSALDTGNRYPALHEFTHKYVQIMPLQVPACPLARAEAQRMMVQSPIYRWSRSIEVGLAPGSSNECWPRT